MINFSLKEKVSIITGASRGIGKAIALGFVESGAKVVISSRKMENLEKVREEIESKGGECFVVPAHSGKEEDLKNLVEKTLEKYGKIDILVNNAATNPIFGPIMDAELSAWDKIMEVNLRGYFILSKLCAKIMMEQKKGCIINIASFAGIKPTPFLGVYSISKAGVISLTKVMAQELAPYNIRVNAIAPGLVETKFSYALWGNEEILKMALQNIPLGRIAKPEEIAGAAIFLASDSASYITGEVLVISGGQF
jgi:NAD(P)-dependent dehydrogenase (short-subunit alcohol dehydrogenase family)